MGIFLNKSSEYLETTHDGLEQLENPRGPLHYG